MVPSDGIRDSGQNLKDRRFPLSINTHIFTVWVTEHRLPIEVVDSSSLPGHRPEQTSQCGPAQAGG